MKLNFTKSNLTKRKKALALLMSMTIAAGLTGCAPKNANVPINAAEESTVCESVGEISSAIHEVQTEESIIKNEKGNNENQNLNTWEFPDDPKDYTVDDYRHMVTYKGIPITMFSTINELKKYDEKFSYEIDGIYGRYSQLFKNEEMGYELNLYYDNVYIARIRVSCYPDEANIGDAPITEFTTNSSTFRGETDFKFFNKLSIAWAQNNDYGSSNDEVMNFFNESELCSMSDVPDFVSDGELIAFGFKSADQVKCLNYNLDFEDYEVDLWLICCVDLPHNKKDALRGVSISFKDKNPTQDEPVDFDFNSVESIIKINGEELPDTFAEMKESDPNYDYEIGLEYSSEKENKSNYTCFLKYNGEVVGAIFYSLDYNPNPDLEHLPIDHIMFRNEYLPEYMNVTFLNSVSMKDSEQHLIDTLGNPYKIDLTSYYYTFEKKGYYHNFYFIIGNSQVLGMEYRREKI